MHGTYIVHLELHHHADRILYVLRQPPREWPKDGRGFARSFSPFFILSYRHMALVNAMQSPSAAHGPLKDSPTSLLGTESRALVDHTE